MLSIDELYREHAKKVYAYIFSCTRNTELAEEITQETFFRAMKSINRYNGECKIYVWLCQIAKHILYQKIRNAKKDQWVELHENIDIKVDSPEQSLINSEDKKKIYKSMQVLNEITKEVIYLRLTGELSFKEIGEILNKSENWARVTFFRGKSKLLRRLKNEE